MSRSRSTASRALDPSVFDALASPGVSVEGTVVPRLGAALATMDEPVVLVLDDLHLLDNPACLDAIAALARHVPDGSQLALSRAAPALPLGALRARGLALEIGPDDLRMDEAEARQLLSAAGVDLPDRGRRAHRAHGGLVRRSLPRRAVDRGRGVKGRGRVLGERPSRVRLPAVGVARAPVCGRLLAS